MPLRVRVDGWTPLRQAESLGHLAETHSISKAAKRVGMSRESAYRLREKPGAGEFVAAWDAILGVPAAVPPPPRKVTLDALLWRIEQGRYRPLLRGGRYVATIQNPTIARFWRRWAGLTDCCRQGAAAADRKVTKNKNMRFCQAVHAIYCLICQCRQTGLASGFLRVATREKRHDWPL